MSTDRTYRPGTRVRVALGSGINSGEVGHVVSEREVRTSGRGVALEVQGAYYPLKRNEVYVRLENGELIQMPKSRLQIFRPDLFEAGVWEQGRGFVPWSRHGTEELAIRAAREYARAQKHRRSGGSLSWSGGVRHPNGEVKWYPRLPLGKEDVK